MATLLAMTTDTFTQGKLFADEGFATYAKTVEGNWVSIKGQPGEIKEIRWTVTDPDKIKKLESIVNTFKGPARYFGKEE
jgi:hydrogenase maturation factor